MDKDKLIELLGDTVLCAYAIEHSVTMGEEAEFKLAWRKRVDEAATAYIRHLSMEGIDIKAHVTEKMNT